MDKELSLCARGCGFYGTPEKRNMCSKCFNDLPKEDTTKYLDSSKLKPVATKLPDCPPPPPPAASPPPLGEVKTIASNRAKNRCKCCNKKVGLLGFECRCGHVYCGAHRYPEEHSCPSDYKTAAREALAKANPLTKAEKLYRI